jgi:hypothetical protein
VLDLADTPTVLVIDDSTWSVIALAKQAPPPSEKDKFSILPPPRPPEPDVSVAIVKSKSGIAAAVTRASAPNPDAWRERTRAAYVDEIERGVSSIAGYKRVKRVVSKVNGVPAMDLEFTRTVDGKRETVVARFLFWRTYTLTLAASGTKDAMRRDRKKLDQLIKRFGPPTLVQ